MNILTRYIIKEHLMPFFFSLAVLMFIFLMNFLVKYITQIFGKGLSLFTIVELIFYNLAWMFALAVPMAVLITALMSFGRLSGDNEITILKSSGISIYKIIRPALVFAFIITVLMIIFNDRILPDFNHKARVMFHNIREKKPTLKLEPGIFFDVDKFSFQVEKIEKPLAEELTQRTNILGPEFNTETPPDKLINVTIFDRSNPSQNVTVIAKEGYMVYSSEKKSIIFTLYDGQYHVLDNMNTTEYRYSYFPKNVVTISAPEFELEETDDEYRGDRELNVSMMMEKINQNRSLIENEAKNIQANMDKHLQAVLPGINNFKPPKEKMEIDSKFFDTVNITVKQQANEKAFQKTSRLFQMLRTSRSRISSYRESVNRYLVEVHKKFSIPFASLVFVLIGAPMGIAARKGSLGVGATISIIFFLIYWACLILGEDLADRKLLTPFWAMWFPNILIGVAGGYLTWRAVKETSVLKLEKFTAIFKWKKKGETGKVESIDHAE